MGLRLQGILSYIDATISFLIFGGVGALIWCSSRGSKRLLNFTLPLFIPLRSKIHKSKSAPELVVTKAMYKMLIESFHL